MLAYLLLTYIYILYFKYRGSKFGSKKIDLGASSRLLGGVFEVVLEASRSFLEAWGIFGVSWGVLRASRAALAVKVSLIFSLLGLSGASWSSFDAS